MKYAGTWHPSTHLRDVASRPARELDYANSKVVKWQSSRIREMITVLFKFRAEDMDAHDGNNAEQSNDLHQQITFESHSSAFECLSQYAIRTNNFPTAAWSHP